MPRECQCFHRITIIINYINNLDSDNIGGSVADLRSKKKGSQSSLSKLKGNVGGSLMNIGSKQTGIKKFTDSSMDSLRFISE